VADAVEAAWQDMRGRPRDRLSVRLGTRFDPRPRERATSGTRSSPGT